MACTTPQFTPSPLSMPPLSSSSSECKTKRPSFHYEQIKIMFSSELYSNLMTFSSWVLSLAEKQPELLSELQKCHVYILNGDAAFRMVDFHLADSYYRRALDLYKFLIRSSPNLKPKLQEDCGTSTDVKFKIHLCLVQTKKITDALKMLQSIPAKQRNVQINMAMGDLFRQTGMERAAITSYKEVLRVCPMALDAVEQLLLLGCNEDDVQSLVREKTVKYMPHPEWYNSWIRGTAAMAARDNLTSVKIFKEIREKHSLASCISLLHSLGVASSNYGDYASAIAALKMAHHFEPTNLKGMDLYAFLLWHEDMQQELSKLMTQLNENNHNEARSEPWIATAYYTLSANRLNRAQVFALRGSTFHGAKNPEGMIAQGQVFLRMKKYQEAVECFREVMARHPERFEPHRGIVECYLATARGREAVAVALGALKTVGNSPRVFNLCATAMKKDPLTLAKAKTYLEKALEIDSSFLPAVLNFVEILESEGKYNEAIQMLKSYIDLRICPSMLYVKLAALYSRNGMDETAADQFATALRLDPSNKEARDGLNRLDPSSSRGNEQSFEAGGEDMDLEDEDDEEKAPLPKVMYRRGNKRCHIVFKTPACPHREPYRDDWLN